jgi:hypothetical protein
MTALPDGELVAQDQDLGGLPRIVAPGWPQPRDHLRDQAARANPGGAHAAAVNREGGETQLIGLRPDKPWDDPTIHPTLLADIAAVAVPDLDTLTHDAAYFSRVLHAVIPGGKLDELRSYYSQ